MSSLLLSSLSSLKCFDPLSLCLSVPLSLPLSVYLPLSLSSPSSSFAVL